VTVTFQCLSVKLEASEIIQPVLLLISPVIPFALTSQMNLKYAVRHYKATLK
jgi:hypothetical protein